MCIRDSDICIEGGKPKELMAEEIKEHIFYNSVENFWLTNSIARSSKILCDRNEFSSNGVFKI